MVNIAIFRKSKKNPTDRTLVFSGRGKTTSAVIKNVKRAGVLRSGNFVAFRIVKDKKAFKIDGIRVSKKGKPFKF